MLDLRGSVGVVPSLLLTTASQRSHLSIDCTIRKKTGVMLSSGTEKMRAAMPPAAASTRPVARCARLEVAWAENVVRFPLNKCLKAAVQSAKKLTGGKSSHVHAQREEAGGKGKSQRQGCPRRVAWRCPHREKSPQVQGKISW